MDKKAVIGTFSVASLLVRSGTNYAEPYVVVLAAIVVVAPVGNLAAAVVVVVAATTVKTVVAVVRVNIPTPLPNIAAHVI